MQDLHYKLILIIAMLACAVPSFLGYDSYQTVRDARIQMQETFLANEPAELAVFQQYVFNVKDAIFTYVMFNTLALMTLLLIIMYLANRTYFAEQAVELYIKSHGDKKNV